MRVLIIEDELPASKRMTKMIRSMDPSIDIAAVIESVDDGVAWLETNAPPDLIFADIQLSDGSSFEIFKKIRVECPVVFTTAYDEYALEAFKVNSIDYLLKPIDQTALVKSIEKFNRLKKTWADENTGKLEALLRGMELKKPEYKSRFLVKSGQAMQTVAVRDISYFYIDTQLVFLITIAGKKFMLENTLDELEHVLDPDSFFRINRQMIVSLNSIKKIHPYFNSRLKLDLEPDFIKDVLVSRKKVNQFKGWLND